MSGRSAVELLDALARGGPIDGPVIAVAPRHSEIAQAATARFQDDLLLFPARGTASMPSPDRPWECGTVETHLADRHRDIMMTVADGMPLVIPKLRRLRRIDDLFAAWPVCGAILCADATFNMEILYGGRDFIRRRRPPLLFVADGIDDAYLAVLRREFDVFLRSLDYRLVDESSGASLGLPDRPSYAPPPASAPAARRHALIVSPVATHPGNQGSSVRIRNLGRLLQRSGCFVHLLHYALDGPYAADTEAMSAAWDFVYRIPADFGGLKQSLGDQFAADDWWHPDVGRLARHLDKLWRFDLCVANYVWCSAVLDDLPDRVVKVIDTHDVFADREARSAAAGVDAAWFSTSRTEEALGLARADIVLAIQDDEARYFETLGLARVETLGLINPQLFLPPRPRADRLRVGYLGSGNPWNIHAIRQFHAALLERPALHRQLDLVAAGPICDAIADFNQLFTPLGIVEAAADFYREVDLVVNPMIGGTGLKIKSVEALGYGLPLLSTADGSVGIGSPYPGHNLPNLAALLDALAVLAQSPASLIALSAQSRLIFSAYTARQRATFDRVFGR